MLNVNINTTRSYLNIIYYMLLWLLVCGIYSSEHLKGEFILYTMYIVRRIYRYDYRYYR